jgi:hypothetical protein
MKILQILPVKFKGSLRKILKTYFNKLENIEEMDKLLEVMHIFMHIPYQN